MQLTSRILVSLLLALGLLALSAGQTLAAVAANTQIVNRATMSYYDGTTTQTSSSTVTVTVALVPSPPGIEAGPQQTITYAGANTQLVNSFTVIATSNGPDSYSLATTITASANTTDASAEVSPLTSITLGASVTLTGSYNAAGDPATTVLVVPSDGLADNAVNAIEAGDLVRIGNSADTFTVTAVADNDSGTSTITVTPALTTAPGAGVLIAEEMTVTVIVRAGSVETIGTDVTVDKNLTAASTTDNTRSATSSAIRDTYTSGASTLVKYVRNVSQAGVGSTSYDYAGNTYYRSGVQAGPGQVLEYLLVANNSSSGEVTAAMINDVLPTDFVILRSNAYGSGEVTYIDDQDAASTLTALADADAASYAGGTLTVYVGTGATSSEGGTIPAASSVMVLYQVTIKP